METHFQNMGKEQVHSTHARERVMTDLKSLIRHSEDLLKATAGDLSERMKETRSHLTSALERARESCENLQEEAMGTARAAAKKADTVIRSHPYESLGAGFGLGLLIGALVTRK